MQQSELLRKLHDLADYHIRWRDFATVVDGEGNKTTHRICYIDGMAEKTFFRDMRKLLDQLDPPARYERSEDLGEQP